MSSRQRNFIFSANGVSEFQCEFVSYYVVDFIEANVPRNRYYDVIRGIAFAYVFQNIVARKSGNVAFCAQNGTGKSMPFIKGRGRDFVRKVVGSVVAHCDFFKDYALLPFEFLVGKNAVEKDVRQNVGAFFKIRIDALNIIAGCGFGRISVYSRTHPVGFGNYIECRPFFRTFEHRVLDEMRYSVVFRILVYASRFYEHADSRASDVGHLIIYERQPVVVFSYFFHS